MDELLDALTPLAQLLARLPAETASTAVERLTFAASDLACNCAAHSTALQALLHELFGADSRQARAALTTALTPLPGAGRAVTADTAASPSLSPSAETTLPIGRGAEVTWLRLGQVDVLARQLRAQRVDEARLVLTVPDFLRLAWLDLLAGRSDALPPRQTLPVLFDLAAGARRTLVLAAPYLNVEQAQMLAAQIARLTASNGHALVMTWLGSRNRGNWEALQILQAAAHEPGRLDVWAWEGHTLGLHFKVVVADGEAAYLGSANLTTLGALGHAEAGVLLRGQLAAQLESWLRLVASTATSPPARSRPPRWR